MGDQWTKREALSNTQHKLFQEIVLRAMAGGWYIVGHDGLPRRQTIKSLVRRGLIVVEGGQLHASYGVCVALDTAGVDMGQ